MLALRRQESKEMEQIVRYAHGGRMFRRKSGNNVNNWMHTSFKEVLQSFEIKRGNYKSTTIGIALLMSFTDKQVYICLRGRNNEKKNKKGMHYSK